MSAEIPAARVRLIERIIAAARSMARQIPQERRRGISAPLLHRVSPKRTCSHATRHTWPVWQWRIGAPVSTERRVARWCPFWMVSSAPVPPRARTRWWQWSPTDMPFLVDSLLLAFSRLGIGVHLIIHPVFDVHRSRAAACPRRESWQLFEVDRQIEPARLELIKVTLNATLAEVRAAVSDWQPMLQQAQVAARELADADVPHEADVVEAQALIEWMVQGYFTFLGYRRYRLRRGARQDQLLSVPESGLGILRAGRPGVPPPTPTVLTGAMQREARAARAVLVTKANTRSTVHRGSYLDYVGMRTFDARGRVTGEHRFLGLWTSSAYESSPRSIPLLKDKLNAVTSALDSAPGGHDAKALAHVLETYPRDELFQASVAELVRSTRGIVNLYERSQVRLFARRDPFDRFYACLVYVPRDRYDTRVLARIETVLRTDLGGQTVESQVEISDSTLARLYVVVRLGSQRPARVDLARIEHALARAASTWQAGLREALTASMDEAAALALWTRFAHLFPAAYTDQVSPAAALGDIAELMALGPQPDAMRLRLHRAAGEAGTQLHLTLFRRGDRGLNLRCRAGDGELRSARHCRATVRNQMA